MKQLKLEPLILTLVVAVTAAANDASTSAELFISWKDLIVTRNDIKSGRAIVVDQNGRGNSITIQGAVDLIPANNESRMKILVYTGTYNETVEIPANKSYVSIIGRPNTRNGDFPVITSCRKASDTDQSGNMLGSMNTATVLVQSNYFVAAALTIENSAVPSGHGDQALAIRIDGDKSVFYKVRFLGYQDTLMDNIGTHLFYHCYIEGSIDFICGSATSLYQDCTINSTRAGAIAAHERNTEDDSGFIFEDCKILGTGPTILGRAWGNYSRIIYSFCTFHNIIDPVGWSDWDNPYKQNTSFFGEYMNQGPGSNRIGRASWSKSLSDDQAIRYVGRTFIKGHDWLKI
ncbi:pectinesterase QRT1-like [Prosopis cineraria]|uniref:pectinesterase QRT1-like n=1 Tax=Prosopis cineraria TaxID=364024 RepID=UPI002410A084|nr:pectinesterase QRT1-like [Prosopis cineraria]